MFMRSMFLQLLIWILFSALAFAQGTPSLTIENKKGQVEIQANNISLGEVLAAINEQTGIRFSVSEEFQSDPVTARLTAPDWKTSVKMLLEPYARMELWNEPLKLSKIKILSRDPNASFPSLPVTARKAPTSVGGPGTSGSGTVSNVQRTSKPLPRLDKSKLPNPQGLNKKQLRRLGRGKLKSPLSPGFLTDPALGPFLAQFGIVTPEDAKDTFKAMKVRVHARRLAQKK